MPKPPDEWRGARGPLLALAVIGLFAAVLHHEVLFGGAVYHMDDAADGYYPGHIAVQRAFAHGELPLWERGSWCGWPLIVDPYNGVFYPPNLIYYALGAARGLGVSIAFHVLLGGAGMWLLLRRRRLSFEVALFGGLAFALSTFGVVRIRHVIFVQMMAWLPWILVGIEGWVATRRRRELVLVALSTGLALIAGALSIGHFAALVIAGYAVARVAQRDLGRAFADAGALIAAALVGVLIAAVQLAPTLAHLPHSPRSLGSDYAFASSYAWPQLRYLWTLLAPDLFGGENRARYVGAPNHWELAGWYCGALAVVLAPCGLLAARNRGELRRRGAELPALALLVLLAIGLAFGDAGPVHPLFFRFVPLYAALRCPARALLVAVVALPILSAHGVAALLERARPVRQLWRGWAPALAIALAGAVAWWLLQRRAAGAALPIELESTAWAHCASVVAAGAALLVAAIAGGLRARFAALALALVLAVDLVQVGRGYLQPQPPEYPSGMERFAAVEWLLAQPPGDRFVHDPNGPFRLHNLGMVLGRESASGYDSVGIWRYVNFLYLLQNGRLYPEAKLKHDFAGIGVHNLSSPLLDLMSVRWLIAVDAPPPRPGQPQRWLERFRPPAAHPAPAARFEPVWDSQLKVFENTTALPRAFVAYRAEFPGDDTKLAARLVDPRFDPGRVVLLEAPPPPSLSPSPSPPPSGETRPPTPATITEAGRQRLVIDVDAAAPGVLVVSDAFYPGWQATVDGVATNLLRADWAFRGVTLPAGHHRVVMTYRSWPFRVGVVLSCLGLALVALFARGGRARRNTATAS